MPRYRFDLHNGNGMTVDEEGRELPDQETARAEALKGIRSILAEDVLRGYLDLGGRIEVLDDRDGLLFTVDFADAIRIQSPAR